MENNPIKEMLLKDPITTMLQLIEADSENPGVLKEELYKMSSEEPELLNSALNYIAQQSQSGDQTASVILEKLSEELSTELSTSELQAVSIARYGAKLEYIKKLQGICPEGYLMAYFKAGGRICSKCVKKAEKAKCGTRIQEAKCGRKVAKGAQGFIADLEEKKKKNSKQQNNTNSSNSNYVGNSSYYNSTADKNGNNSYINSEHKDLVEKLNKGKLSSEEAAKLRKYNIEYSKTHKCGGKVQKKKMTCGGKATKKAKKCFNGGILNWN